MTLNDTFENNNRGDKSKRPSSFEINYKIGDKKYTEIIKNN